MNVSARILSIDDNYELAVRKLVSLGVPNREINVLMPEPGGGETKVEAEDARFLVRGVGRVVASGDRAKALLDLIGATRDRSFGSAGSGEGAGEGLPLDDFFVFEDALRKRRTVVFVSTPERHQWEKVESALEECGGQDVRQSREEWWSEICGKEDQAVETRDAPHDVDDYLFRLGFEVALHPRWREMTREEADEGLRRTYPEACDVESFRQGYARGRAHQEALDGTTAGAAGRG